MCLIKQHRFPKFTFKDITVYKLVNKSEDKYSTPFQECTINIGETYRSSKNIFKAIFRNVVEGEGIHSFSSLKLAKCYKSSCLTIVQCVIPKGSWYYYGNYYDIASNKLKYVKIID